MRNISEISDTDASDSSSIGSRHQNHYKKLFCRFVLLTVVCSLAPLLFVGWAISIHYKRFAHERLITAFSAEVDHHRKVIEQFLKEHSSKLQLIAGTHTQAYLTESAHLEDVFDLINREHWSITDLGVINVRGRHVAYIGPFDLLDINYADTHWFGQVMNKGVYISDMFLCYRREPHFIIAVTGNDYTASFIFQFTFWFVG